MLRMCGLLLLAVVALAVLTEPVFGQIRLRGGRRFPAGTFNVEIDGGDAQPEADGTPVAAPTVEELLRRLDALEARTETPAARERGLALMLEDSQLASTNYYDPSGIRYFVTRLILINLTDQALTIPSSGIVLQSDGTELQLSDATSQLSRQVLQIGGQLRNLSPLPESLTAPARGSVSTWLTYAGIDAVTAVPSLKLVLTWEGGSESLDINTYQRGVLGLRTERLGPQNCGALLTINGELNSINAETLADELDALAGAGVVRAVVAWGESAPRPDEHILGWLATGSSEEMGMQHSQLPRIPVAVREFHLVQPPGSESNPFSNYGPSSPVHRTADGAMSAALRTAFEAVPRDDLRAELAHGHRLSRGAALAYGGARLGRRELPLVLAACDDADEFVRLQALVALGQYNDRDAVERLLAAAASADPATAQAAVASLAGSRYPEAHAALRTFLDGLDVPRTIAVVDVLARFPRGAWMDRIAAYYESPDPQLRLAALRALVRLGHPDIVALLAAALAADEADLRAEAYVQLVLRTDVRSEELASAHALRLLESERPDAHTYSLLMRTRDRRALPLLLKHLDAAKEDRDTLITLVAQVGGEDVFADLLARYPQFPPSERAAVLEALLAGKSPAIRPLALEALTAGDPQLVDVGSRILAAQPDEETVPLLVQALSKSTTVDAWSAICSALANIGDGAARAALLTARQSENPQLRDQANGALTRIKHSSPAYQYAFQASQEIEEGNRPRAEKLLDLAISFDPEFAGAYARRGHLMLLQQKLPEARTDFERACALDPFDSLALTGRAIVIVMQGDPAEGVRQIREAVDEFPGDAGFEYNSACVYGRAIEGLQSNATEDAVTVRAEYQAAGLRHLRNAMQFGFNSVEFFEKDPDLEVFRDLPEYKELLANPPALGGEPGEDGGEIEVPGDDIELNVRSLR